MKTRLIAAVVLAFLVSSKSPAITAPSFHGTLIDGTPVSLEGLLAKKHFVLLSFWATWCLPCLDELSHVPTELKARADMPVDFVTVNVDLSETRNEIRPTLRRLKKNSGFDSPVVLDETQDILLRYQSSRTLPFAVLISPSGQIVETFSGNQPGMIQTVFDRVSKASAPKPTTGAG